MGPLSKINLLVIVHGSEQLQSILSIEKSMHKVNGEHQNSDLLYLRIFIYF